MRQGTADGIADDGDRGLVPTDSGFQPVCFQAQERGQREPEVCSLPAPATHLAPLYAAALLDAPMLLLYPPALYR